MRYTFSMSEKYVYVYLDPQTLEVRYVGSGSFRRMIKHTTPSALADDRNDNPFRRWIRQQPHINWRDYRFRIIGPVSEEIAHIWENALILEHFETILNIRAPDGKELRRAVNRTNGVCRQDSKWRASIQINGEFIKKRFSNYYEALKWRKEKEKELTEWVQSLL